MLLALLTAIAGAGIIAGVACGGGSGNSRAGEAAAAVADYWKQEQAGGLLPEGTEVLQQGVESPTKLKARSGERARYCAVFRYLERADTTKTHGRVYVARLQGDAWAIESVNPDGTCDGVS